ncbi:MAG: acetyl-CoA carboxylase biotin carboxyl carrier protein [Phycisphaerales bacterium]
MIDIRKLKELVRLMVENDLTEIDLKDKEETVVVRRGSSPATIVNHNPAYYGGGNGPAPAASAPAAGTQAPGPAPVSAPASASSPPTAPAAPSTAGLTIIKSPMVGTVYLSPNPDSPVFVASGVKVSETTTVCLIEAMKVFNEIKAECSGTIAQVFVKNGQAVEYGQPLYGVKPE